MQKVFVQDQELSSHSDMPGFKKGVRIPYSFLFLLIAHHFSFGRLRTTINARRWNSAFALSSDYQHHSHRAWRWRALRSPSVVWFKITTCSQSSNKRGHSLWTLLISISLCIILIILVQKVYLSICYPAEGFILYSFENLLNTHTPCILWNTSNVGKYGYDSEKTAQSESWFL